MCIFKVPRSSIKSSKEKTVVKVCAGGNTKTKAPF